MRQEIERRLLTVAPTVNFSPFIVPKISPQYLSTIVPITIKAIEKIKNALRIFGFFAADIIRVKANSRNINRHISKSEKGFTMPAIP